MRQSYIKGLRSLDTAQPEDRELLLYRLAGIYEFAPVIGKEVAEEMAEKLQVPEIQAQEVNMPQAQLMQHLLAIDQAWRDPIGQVLPESIADLISQPMIPG